MAGDNPAGGTRAAAAKTQPPEQRASVGSGDASGTRVLGLSATRRTEREIREALAKDKVAQARIEVIMGKVGTLCSEVDRLALENEVLKARVAVMDDMSTRVESLVAMVGPRPGPPARAEKLATWLAWLLAVFRGRWRGKRLQRRSQLSRGQGPTKGGWSSSVRRGCRPSRKS